VHTYFTGDRPNGRLHLGHYVGSMKTRLARQHTGEQYLMIADYLALTDNIDDPRAIAANVLEIGTDYLACGIDPRHTTCFVQSDVLELQALTAIYLNLADCAEILDNTAKNEEIDRRGFGSAAPAGMFTYTVSQVADITAFGADRVPVGTDQIPLVAFAADIVRRFNSAFGSTLVVPEPDLASTGRLPGFDGRPKMGKSLANTIDLSDSDDTIVDKLAKLPIDLHRPDDAWGVYYREFTGADPQDEAVSGEVMTARIRSRITEAVNAAIAPIRERRATYAADPAEVARLLTDGGVRASEVATETLRNVKTAAGLRYTPARPR
jgi:tryptophanyl-tRNA synthetase